ncbi:MAG: ABC transporter ATP-binding protein [Desulfurococcales archaeon]|nr:ABC transporter ATP-binding protein [Desulfurococcales archaeon]
MPEIIKLINVKKAYRVGNIVTWGLRGVDLVVEEGEFISIIGPSGSGKTTLLNMLGLLDKPSSGKILIEGIDVSTLGDRELARLRNRMIGFVFQTFNLINRLTVLENIELPLIVRSIPRSKRIELVKKALLMAGGDPSWLKKKPNQLSGGQQQRVAIARAIVGNPRILLADEPTGNLDRASAKIVIQTFKNLHSRGQTIIVVTHDPEVANCTQKIYLLQDGKIIGLKKPDPDKCILVTV